MSATTTLTAEVVMQLLNESKTRRLSSEEWALCETFANEDDPAKRESRLQRINKCRIVAEAAADAAELGGAEDAQTAPAAPDPVPNFPSALKLLPNWTTWKMGSRDGGKLTKIPHIAGTGFSQYAKTNDPTTWRSFAEAVADAGTLSSASGIGFVVADESELVGFDLDGCRNPATEEIIPWALQIVKSLPTYCEITPSGYGLRIWAKGDLPRMMKQELRPEVGFGDKVGIEIYSHGRYFTVTGNRLEREGVLSSVEALDLSEALALCAKFGEQWAVGGAATKSRTKEVIRPVDTTDGTVRFETVAIPTARDERYDALAEDVGFEPLLHRLKEHEDPRFRISDYENGKLEYCPIPSHGPQDINMEYSRCFGPVPGNPNVLHCVICNWSGDVVAACYAVGGGAEKYRGMWEVAKTICEEEGLNYEDYFPKDAAGDDVESDVETPEPLASESATAASATPPIDLDAMMNRDPKTFTDEEIKAALEATARRERALAPAEQTYQDCDGEAEQGDNEEPYPEFPIFTGALTDLARAIHPSLPLEFKMWGLITRWGIMRSGLDKLEWEAHLQPRFDTVFVCPPNRGKTASINESGYSMEKIVALAAARLPQNAANPCSPVLAIKSVDSGPALIVDLSDHLKEVKKLYDGGRTTDFATKIILDNDELSDVFEKAKTGQNSKNTIFKEFLRLHSGNHTGSSTISRGVISLDNAHFAILSGATYEDYPKLWVGTGGGASGLASRVFTISTNAPALPFKKLPTDEAAAAVAHDRLAEYAILPPQTIKMSAEAAKMLEDFWDSHPKKDTDAGTRIAEGMKQLLIVLAPTNGLTIVPPSMAAEVIAWADAEIAVRERLMPPDSWSHIQAMEGIIEKWVRKNASAKNPTTRRLVMRKIRPERQPGGYGAFNLAWNNLVNAEALKLRGKDGKLKLYSWGF